MQASKWLSWMLLLIQSSRAAFGSDWLAAVRPRTGMQPRSRLLNNGDGNTTCDSPACYRYYGSRTKPFFIESWPDVDFDAGEFYGGEIPISKADPSRSLFFIFKPSQGPPVDEITIWLQGGPGCSSLQGFLQENGPISWLPGTAQPGNNPHAWSKLTNMLWVDQPVGTGFSQGEVMATNEIDVAKDFAGFVRNWEEVFDIKNYKVYLTGESYAGRYVPYIGQYMLQQNDTEHFDLKGALMYDPCIGGCNLIQGVYPTYPFVSKNKEILNLDTTTVDEIEAISKNCGYLDYIDKYLQFPPPSIQPPEPKSLPAGNCDPTGPLSKVFEINPCFNPDHITNYCPKLYDPLEGSDRYFNRVDVKAAIHAPSNVTWSSCASRSVFKGGVDSSPDSIVAALPQMIEATSRVLVSNGDWDLQLYTNGTLLVIQNMTWNGHLGFQEAPSKSFIVPSQGVMGKMHYERGLQWLQSYQSGHMQPQYQPQASFRHLQWLLGRISTL